MIIGDRKFSELSRLNALDIRNRDHVQAGLNSQIKAEFLDLPNHTNWESGHVLYEVNITRRDGLWHVRLKSTKNRKLYVRFEAYDSWGDCIEFVGYSAANHHPDWQLDKYPSDFMKALVKKF